MLRTSHNEGCDWSSGDPDVYFVAYTYDTITCSNVCTDHVLPVSLCYSYKPWYLEECSSTLATTYSSGTPGHDKSVATVDMDAKLRPDHICTVEHTGNGCSRTYCMHRFDLSPIAAVLLVRSVILAGIGETGRFH